MSKSSTYLCSLFTVVKHRICTSVFHIAFLIIYAQNLQEYIISRSSMMRPSSEAINIEVVVSVGTIEELVTTACYNI